MIFMKKLLLRIRHKRKLKQLRRSFDYTIGKMNEHTHDIDPTEWARWAKLGRAYLVMMDEEVTKYAQKMRD
ncbi:hypothetical protein BRYFOR_08582 [Marvinbryantia formatexigens DSM 14469]|uniref:Uncharacterized protein n=2 Tax=Marvinbryantia TaxID=248744 RepID=C6LIV2_9FIRM|nr:hypothetical protein BRYFOR_08582 [Marvinbryantia formatexigens DSM 14469]